MRRSRRSGARGRAAACCSRPTSTRATCVAFAVVRGALVAKRRLPRRATRGSSWAPSRLRWNARPTPAAALEPRAEGPWLPAERYAEALLLAQAFAGRAPGVVPIACTAPDALRSGGSPRRAGASPCACRCRPGAMPRAEELAAVA